MTRRHVAKRRQRFSRAHKDGVERADRYRQALEMVGDMVPISRQDVHTVIAHALDDDPIPVWDEPAEEWSEQ